MFQSNYNFNILPTAVTPLERRGCHLILSHSTANTGTPNQSLTPPFPNTPPPPPPPPQDVKVSQDLNAEFHDSRPSVADNVNIKILNAGAWARGSERVAVTLPTELEDYIPELEEFYKAKHSGRKLQWHHHMSNGTVTFTSKLVRSTTSTVQLGTE